VKSCSVNKRYVVAIKTANLKKLKEILQTRDKTKRKRSEKESWNPLKDSNRVCHLFIQEMD
jgi:hypothetical protein